MIRAFVLAAALAVSFVAGIGRDDASTVTIGSDGAPQMMRRAAILRREELQLQPGGISGFAEQQSENSSSSYTHRLSSISERWGDQIVYAVFTSSLKKYHDNLLAELETWAAMPHQQGRFVAMGGNDFPEAWKEPGAIMATPCCDGVKCLACKEVHLLVEAAARKAKWVVVLGEDNWVNVEGLEQALAEYDSNSSFAGPLAVGVMGCGKGEPFCPEVQEQGGFCGGCGYAINGLALQRLVEHSADTLIHEYTSQSWPNDVTTSCALRTRNIPFYFLGSLSGYPIQTKAELENRMSQFLTMHYLPPAALRWLHAKRQATSDPSVATNLSSLAEAAFDHQGNILRGKELLSYLASAKPR